VAVTPAEVAANIDVIIVGLLNLTGLNSTEIEKINITSIEAGSTVVSGDAGSEASSGISGASSGIPGTSYSVGSVQTAEIGGDADDEGMGMGLIAGAAAGGVILSIYLPM